MTKEKNPDFVVLTFRVRREFKTMMDELVDEKKAGTRAEIFRDAIFSYYRKIKPKYLEPSDTQQEKARQAAIAAELDAMTDEQYATTQIKGEVYSTPQGVKYCVTHTIGNNIKILPIEKVREYFNQYPQDLEYHLAKLSETPIKELLKHRAYKADLEALGVVL